MTARAYLDHNATTPLRPEARDAMVAAMDVAGNPSSPHAEGRAARRLVDDARECLAALMGVKPSAIYFTSGGTEAANWLLTPRDTCDGVLALGATEHHCVLRGHRFDRLTQELSVGWDGLVALDSLGEAVSAVAVHSANNETGVIQPVERVARWAQASGAVFICDAVQVPGRIDLDEVCAGSDAFFISAHKFGGPKGVGAAVIVNESARPEPLIRGGGQESRQRSGTENVIGVAGMAAALGAAVRDLSEFGERALIWRDRIETGIREIARDAVIFGKDAPRLPNTTCLAVPGLDAETMLMSLDLDSVAISAGSACSSGRIGHSHVLAAMGVAPDLARGAVRVSTGWTTTDSDIERFLAALSRICSLRRNVLAA
jgi:cysteine desulfurase